ncbi:MAG TPA: serine/threonine-protein kinase, partial [Candidatus Obscuribacterales bacterium]
MQREPQANDKTDDAKESTLSLPGYEIVGVLGTGGMSTVYKARQEQMARIVAIKVLHAHLSRDFVHLQRFKQEARLSTMLEHPNIAKLYAFSTTQDGQLYLVIEYCEGQTLREMIEKNRSFSWPQIQEIFQQICAGVGHAHSHGVVHRDLKPANVFIEVNSLEKFDVKLIDFGIAKIDAGDPEMQKLTQTGVIVGSPHYMSPEQCTGEKVDGRADIYAIGCMLYHVLSGRPPFNGESHFELAQKHVAAMPPPLSEICATIDPEL